MGRRNAEYGKGTYYVRVPLVGHCEVVVTAESEEEALNKALDEASLDTLSDWFAVRHVTRGNVCYADVNDVEVDYYEPDPDEPEEG